jgi:hypothetical protein
MKSGSRIALFALCGCLMFGLVGLASAVESAVPLFFVWIPAAAIMLIERRTTPPPPQPGAPAA